MKRTMDVLLILVATPVWLLVFGVVSLAVLVAIGRPVFFHQIRPGLRGRPFVMLKFRTMRTGTGDDAVRLTPFGRFLRGTSLDELPELFNVLRGDMSLVGPRPLLMEYLPLYTADQMRRHEVLPGITGWAQVHGRNALSWEEKFEMDVWYVEHHTMALDVAILARTLWQVVAGRGVTANGHATMLAFTGTPASGKNGTNP
jgi:lipopolysaccharide/colanic/teichoic acid biosynthesis glycosyltransferase